MNNESRTFVSEDKKDKFVVAMRNAGYSAVKRENGELSIFHGNSAKTLAKVQAIMDKYFPYHAIYDKKEGWGFQVSLK